MRFFGFSIEKATHTPFMDEFIKGLSEGKIYSSYCEKCDPQYYFPPRKDCPCGNKAELRELSTNKGKIVAQTKVHFGPESRATDVPYIVAILEFENKLRVMSQVIPKEGDIEVGDTAELIIHEIDEEKVVYGIKKI